MIQTYSCQNLWCGQWVNTSKSMMINENYSPVCSLTCFDGSVKRFFKKLSSQDQILYFFNNHPILSLFYESSYPVYADSPIYHDNVQSFKDYVLSTTKGDFIIIK